MGLTIIPGKPENRMKKYTPDFFFTVTARNYLTVKILATICILIFHFNATFNIRTHGNLFHYLTTMVDDCR